MKIEVSGLILMMMGLSLLPMMLVTCTCFLKISAVLLIVRNAIGVQQVPPNLALHGIALAATLFVMAPVIQQVGQRAEEAGGWQSVANAAGKLDGQIGEVAEPLRQFMSKQLRPELRDTLLASAARLWPPSMQANVHRDSWLIVVPTFALSELAAAFEIGFLIYLPFVVIDIVVSNLLLALGMQMVSPMTIALPLKLLLFVLIDGWTNLISKLLLSYQIA